MRLFDKLKNSLVKTKKNFVDRVRYILVDKSEINDELFEELFSLLVQSDISVKTSEKIINSLKNNYRKKMITKAVELEDLLKEELLSILLKCNEPYIIKPDVLNIILIVGVNGSGKTTSIAKLTNIFKNENKKVLLAAGDTFRAAAIEQLTLWANKLNVNIIKGGENSDPASVVHDAISSAISRKINILLIDTAGRLHTKVNLMEELKKIRKVILKKIPEENLQTLIVLDATVGQNGIQQARLFKEFTNISGIILTKIDGTAKGGIVITIADELNLPVKFIGTGENLDDLQEFKPENFIDALFEKEKYYNDTVV